MTLEQRQLILDKAALAARERELGETQWPFKAVVLASGSLPRRTLATYAFFVEDFWIMPWNMDGRHDADPITMFPTEGVSNEDWLDFMCRDNFANLKMKMERLLLSDEKASSSRSWIAKELLKSGGYYEGREAK
jgi:hypothetical protein